MRMEQMNLSFQGIRISARVYTPDSQPQHRALFVSSPICDLNSWHALCEMLCEAGCLCVCADLPGFGFCPQAANVPQDNDTRARILWGILDEVEKQREEEQTKWHLIGHGNGAAAVMTMALYQPDSTLSCVLISPVLDRFLISPLHSLLKTEFGKTIIQSWHRRAIRDKKHFRILARKIYGENLKKERLSALHRMMNRKSTPALLHRLISEGYTLNEEAFSVSAPLMLIWGMEDRIFGGQIPARLLKRLSKAEKHLVRAAHMAMETGPDMLRDYLRGWFRFAEGQEKPVVSPAKTKQAEKR